MGLGMKPKSNIFWAWMYAANNRQFNAAFELRPFFVVIVYQSLAEQVE